MERHEVERFQSLDEIMEVERTIEVIQTETGKKFRIEIIKHLLGTAAVHYAANYYLQKEDGLWHKYLNFPWIRQETAQNALTEALAYVNDRPQTGEGV